jgi:Rrf2 family protein
LRPTKQTEYALRALLWLADTIPPAAAGGGRQKAAAIAGATGIRPVFAQRVLGQLQRRGFFDARAGRQGGYALARPARRVSLLEVIEAVEGPLATQTCVLREGACGAPGRDRVLHGAWRAGQEALRAAFADTTPAGAGGGAGAFEGLEVPAGVAG